MRNLFWTIYTCGHAVEGRADKIRKIRKQIERHWEFFGPKPFCGNVVGYESIVCHSSFHRLLQSNTPHAESCDIVLKKNFYRFKTF